mmetsp:Transcript_17937/g.55173  ORF Transcript_17937/g.55173 Transcript_17937/m.55173 type:complete len:486 (-) Transcript_17937:22-1479(-)
MVRLKLNLLVLAVALQTVDSFVVDRVVPILHGWHYDDLIRDSIASKYQTPVALVFYSSKFTQGMFSRFGLDPHGKGLPSRAHLFVGSYDIERVDDVWWENEPDDYRLERRFNLTRFPSVVYVPDMSKPVFEVWADHSQGPWKEWLWLLATFDVAVLNVLQDAVDVRVFPFWDAPFHPHPTPIRIAAGTTRKIRVHPGAALTITDAATGATVDAVDALERSASGACETIFVGGSVERAAEIRRRDRALRLRDQDTTYTHGANIRQPPVMPVVNVSSYEILDMPPELVRTIDAFYDSYAHLRKTEMESEESTGINQHVAKTTLVSFDNEPLIRQKIAAELVQPLVEAWAGMELKHTAFYGIREYHRGAELRMHVDKVKTHVYSVIMNIRQEGVEEDWPLELIDFDGEWKDRVLKPGQLLFYQSAKLIHGRPSPFNGSLYANCFCHFAPKVGWDFEKREGDVLYYKGEPLVDYKIRETYDAPELVSAK